MLKVKSLSYSDSLKYFVFYCHERKQTLCTFDFRRKLDQRSVESCSSLEERSTASSSIASDRTKRVVKGTYIFMFVISVCNVLVAFLYLYELCFVLIMEI